MTDAEEIPEDEPKELRSFGSDPCLICGRNPVECGHDTDEDLSDFDESCEEIEDW